MPNNVFVLSLPRSGSTLLQRVMAGSESIYTPSEPWVLIPFLNQLSKRYLTFSEYNEVSCASATNEFIDSVGVDRYIASLRNFYYQLINKNNLDQVGKVFVDKTPRYHLFSSELAKVFPEAKFIVLLRNPMAVAASICDSWRGGVFDVGDYYVDLYDGYSELCSFVKKNKNNRNVLVIDYEEMVRPSFSWKTIFDHIGVTYKEDYIKNFGAVTLAGTKGDQVGVKKYSTLSDNSRDAWRMFYCNFIRRYWLKKYASFVEESGGRHSDFFVNDLGFGVVRQRYLLKDTLALFKTWVVRRFCLSVVRNSRGRVIR